MFGISYGELFLIVGATAALIGPKDLPVIARTAGRLAGRAIGYVQMARGQLDNVLNQSQASQVHKELQDTIAQLDAIRYEIRSISLMNPGPFTRRLDAADPLKNNNTGTGTSEELDGVHRPQVTIPKDLSSVNAVSSTLYSQATRYDRLAEAQATKESSLRSSGDMENIGRSGLLTVLPVSAENAGLLPKRNGEAKGSDIVLEAIVEAEVARNAKLFFSQPENQIQNE